VPASLPIVIHVGISALTLIPGVVGGSETAYRAILRELPKYPDLAPRVFLPSLAADAHEGLPSQVICSYRASTSTPGRLYAMGSSLVAGGRIRREMQLDQLDVLHFPFSTMIPEVTSIPTVTTIHDMQHEALPNLFSRGELNYRRLVYRRAARKSTLVIAVSNHAAADIAEHLNVPRDRIRVVHQGVDLTRFTPASATREEFLLYPANPWAHKNHQRLFEAFSLIRAHRPDLRLVLTGSGHNASTAPDGVEVLGRVPIEQLVQLYRTASALVFPSLYEGFGIPIVEAFATGCPVAASNSSSIPEVCGDAAVLFDPTSAEAIAAGVEQLLADPAPYAERGLARAPLFSWQRCGEAHAAIYRELAQR
jgi:glycosyltransferase involved in cell wall biosynthesis